MKKKKTYIRPNIEIIVTKVENQLLNSTPAGGHGGGNAGDTPSEPAKPVGSVGYGWYEEEQPSNSSSHSLWD